MGALAIIASACHAIVPSTAPLSAGASVRILYDSPSDVVISGTRVPTPPLSQVRELHGVVVQDGADTLRIRITGVRLGSESLYPWTGDVIAHAPRDGRSRIVLREFSAGKTARNGVAGIAVILAVGLVAALVVVARFLKNYE